MLRVFKTCVYDQWQNFESVPSKNAGIDDKHIEFGKSATYSHTG